MIASEKKLSAFRADHPFSYYFHLALKDSPTWKEIEKHLTPRNRKYMLKNLYESLSRLKYPPAKGKEKREMMRAAMLKALGGWR